MSTLGQLKSTVLDTWTNLRGWRTSRKLVVFESDDWGAIRMPGRKAWQALLDAGIRVDRSRYDSFDCLESADDLERLMQVLTSYHDVHGNPARFTFNTVMGNPDFNAIEEDGFRRFHHQHMFDSYQEYGGEDLEPKWRQAMAEGLIRPQLHAREHLNSRLWMSDLQAGHPEARIAFHHRFYGLKTNTGSRQQRNYLAACWAESDDELAAVARTMADGLDLFNQTFEFPSLSFIGCNYVWPRALEPHLSEFGVRLIQGQRAQIAPQPDNGGRARVHRHFTGQCNDYGQRYSVRNVSFEPYLGESADWVARALVQTRRAFQYGKPAVICTHRVNYSGGMDIDHRDRSLMLLERLLSGLLEHWPEIEFISSDRLLELMDDDST